MASTDVEMSDSDAGSTLGEAVGSETLDARSMVPETFQNVLRFPSTLWILLQYVLRPWIIREGSVVQRSLFLLSATALPMT
jgi:hypothetical protein